MALNDPLANILSAIKNAEKVGKSECLVTPTSKMITKVLTIMKEHEYLKNFELIDPARGGLIKITLQGSINNCGVVKPRFSFTRENSEKYEKRYLPAKGFGMLIVSTSQGVMTSAEALGKNIGGKLIAYCY